MTFARHATPEQEHGRFAEARAAEKVHNSVQNRRAARTVAHHAVDTQDCMRLLAMLGLRTVEQKQHDQGVAEPADARSY